MCSLRCISTSDVEKRSKLEQLDFYLRYEVTESTGGRLGSVLWARRLPDMKVATYARCDHAGRHMVSAMSRKRAASRRRGSGLVP